MSPSRNRSILGLALAGVAMATSNDDRPIVQWGACPEVAPYLNWTAPIECGNLRVPLDYTQPNSTQLWDIPLLKVKAPQQPPKGTIQINFGGPGMPVIPSLVTRGKNLLTLSGGAYDIVGFDPRGTDAALPFFCTNETVSVSQIQLGQMDASEGEIIERKTWANTGSWAGICATQGNGEAVGSLVGTAFTARDMQRVAEVLDDDGLIRFWGFSYGTLLGATIAGMFPDKIDRMVIDGVLNPHEYYNDLADFEQFTHTEPTLTYFYESCIEGGPEVCPMAALNKTAEELEADTWTFINALKKQPMPMPLAGAVLDSAVLKGNFWSAFYATENWQGLAQLLTPLIWGTSEGGQKAFLEYMAAQAGPAADSEAEVVEGQGVPMGGIDKFWAIHCSDRVVRASSYEEMAPAFEKLFNISKIQGGSHAATAAVCAQWPWKAKESFTGPFDVDTKHPVLVMGASYDAQTSIASAYNISATFEGSSVLEVEGAAHCGYSLPSACSARYLQEYWLEGVLPEGGAKCEPDFHPWVLEPWTWTDTFDKMGGGSNSTK